MSVAASEGDVPGMIWAISAMILLILLLDQILWRPLVVWTQKFRIEETGPAVATETWFLNVLKNSHLILAVRKLFHFLSRDLQNHLLNKKDSKSFWGPMISRLFLFVVLGLLITVAVFVYRMVSDVSLDKWLYLGKLLLLTFTRVFICLLLGIAIALPLGLAVGLSEKWSGILEPFIQVGASFPATLLFPIMILFLKPPISL